MKNFTPAAREDETEGRHPEAWNYYECDKCGFRVKEFADGRIELPDEAEWNQIGE